MFGVGYTYGGSGSRFPTGSKIEIKKIAPLNSPSSRQIYIAPLGAAAL
jgi:hypothetical protein